MKIPGSHQTLRQFPYKMGETALLFSEGLYFPVTILEAKFWEGAFRFCVTPVNGANEKWVPLTALTPLEVH